MYNLMSETRLSEVDMMLSKLETIKIAMRGKQETGPDTSKFNEFDKIRYEITNLLNEIETFLNSRDDFDKKRSDTNRAVFERQKIQVKIDDRLNPVKQKLDNLKTTIDSDKRKKKPVGHKEDIWKLLKEKYDFLKV
jgi:ElaB/YqjD/DUF883 family membrane-anchored ribosome-binding protein